LLVGVTRDSNKTFVHNFRMNIKRDFKNWLFI